MQRTIKYFMLFPQCYVVAGYKPVFGLYFEWELDKIVPKKIRDF